MMRAIAESERTHPLGVSQTELEELAHALALWAPNSTQAVNQPRKLFVRGPALNSGSRVSRQGYHVTSVVNTGNVGRTAEQDAPPPSVAKNTAGVAV
jgi:hypothetical protein